MNLQKKIYTIPAGDTWRVEDFIENGNKDQDMVIEHLKLMKEAGLLKGEIINYCGGDCGVNLDISWDGHEFLDASRSSKIWETVKRDAAKVGVSYTLPLLLDALKMAAMVALKSVGGV